MGERLSEPPRPKSVNSGVSLCAELFRSSRQLMLKDWIDEGAPSVYSLWLRHVAQSVIRSMLHPIVEECAEVRSGTEEGVRVNVVNVLIRRVLGRLSVNNDRVGIMLRRLLSPHPGNKPGMRIFRKTVPEKDTGGERQLPNPT